MDMSLAQNRLLFMRSRSFQTAWPLDDNTCIPTTGTTSPTNRLQKNHRCIPYASGCACPPWRTDKIDGAFCMAVDFDLGGSASLRPAEVPSFWLKCSRGVFLTTLSIFASIPNYCRRYNKAEVLLPSSKLHWRAADFDAGCLAWQTPLAGPPRVIPSLIARKTRYHRMLLRFEGPWQSWHPHHKRRRS